MYLLVAGGATLVAAYISALCVYNVYFHPLRAYPGPKIFAASRLPYIYYQLQGRLPIRVKELHDMYGPVVRIAPDELAYTSASAWKDIFGFRPGHSQLPKDLRSLPPLPEGDPPDIIRADDVVHSRYRRLLSHAFSAKALEEQHSTILSYVNLLIRRLHENSASPQDLVGWYNWTTFDLIGDLTFGEPFDCLKDQRYHPWVSTLIEGINGGVAISAAGRYGLANVTISVIPKSMKRNFELMWEYTREKVARRLERGTNRPDFTSHFMRNDKDRKEMTQEEMETNALTLTVAGSETTASLLSGATYNLLKNPNVLRQVTEEVRNAYRLEEEIDCTTTRKLHYLTAVLKESLRIYPPAPSGQPRKVLGKGDIIDGRLVPPNTTVGIFQWACNHSDSNFHDPQSFHPERWFDVPPPQFTADSREAMQPFSLGPRNCIGKKFFILPLSVLVGALQPLIPSHSLSLVTSVSFYLQYLSTSLLTAFGNRSLAYVEMRIIMAKILWNFNLTLKEVSKDWADQKAYLIWTKKPLMVKLTPVKRD